MRDQRFKLRLNQKPVDYTNRKLKISGSPFSLDFALISCVKAVITTLLSTTQVPLPTDCPAPLSQSLLLILQ